MSYVVYKHTFPNKKVYIGITGQRPEKRWRNGFGYTHNHFLKSAIEKYGWENIKHEVLFDGITKEEACQKEIELIAEYRSNQREYGYNLSSGGEQGSTGVKHESVWNKGKSGVYSQEVKERIRNGLKKYYQTHKNTSPTKFVKGQKAWNEGVRTPNEVRQKLSEAHKKIKGEKAPRSKPVLQYSMENELVGRFVSATAAAEAMGLKWRNSILNVCKGKSKSAAGYFWKFEMEE